jgi:hypothetical protein
MERSKCPSECSHRAVEKDHHSHSEVIDGRELKLAPYGHSNDHLGMTRITVTANILEHL